MKAAVIALAIKKPWLTRETLAAHFNISRDAVTWYLLEAGVKVTDCRKERPTLPLPDVRIGR